MDDKVRGWQVEGVARAEPGQWAKNLRLQVIAVTMEDAIVAVRAEYPDCKLIKVMADRYIDSVIVAPPRATPDGPQ